MNNLSLYPNIEHLKHRAAQGCEAADTALRVIDAVLREFRRGPASKVDLSDWECAFAENAWRAMRSAEGRRPSVARWRPLVERLERGEA